jgi:hypothetical protein
MDSPLYDSILANATIRKKKVAVDKAVNKELAKKAFSENFDVFNAPLSVSFPSQVGFAQYDIELSDSRKAVGKSFAIDASLSSVRYGLVTILLGKSPIIAAVEGMNDLKQLEVILEDKLIGTVNADSPDCSRFNLWSREGNARISLSYNSVTVHDKRDSFQFGLQLDLNYIPKPILKNHVVNPNVVYQPAIRFCNPVVVMSFLLSLRMIYRRFDF